MTGPEHYQEAERLVSTAGADALDDDFTREEWLAFRTADLAAAQVHATLALAAATALAPAGYSQDKTAWREVAGGAAG
jgi:hypothetical protein